MTAVTTAPGTWTSASPATRRMPPRAATPRGRRASPTTYRRRRLAAATLAVAVVVVMGQAGVALGGTPLAPERRPAVSGPRSVVVRPGDSLWSIAARLTSPGEDPRPLVDALSAARNDEPLIPGETIRWPG